MGASGLPFPLSLLWVFWVCCTFLSAPFPGWSRDEHFLAELLLEAPSLLLALWARCQLRDKRNARGKAVLTPKCLPSLPLFSPTFMPLLALGKG